MVQLPATAAIEYVAARTRTITRTRTGTKTKIGTKTQTKTRTRTKIGTRTKTGTKTGTKTKIGMITKTVRGPYARSPQVQCVYQRIRGFLNGMRYINPRFTYLLYLLTIRTVWAFCA